MLDRSSGLILSLAVLAAVLGGGLAQYRRHRRTLLKGSSTIDTGVPALLVHSSRFAFRTGYQLQIAVRLAYVSEIPDAIELTNRVFAKLNALIRSIQAKRDA
ncbi:hypothetical protein [Rhodanobacter lindaniclasticus]